MRDSEGIEHTAEVSAETLYEALALGLTAIRKSSWVEDVARGLAPALDSEATQERAIKTPSVATPRSSWSKENQPENVSSRRQEITPIEPDC
jgi:hypothetical protein